MNKLTASLALVTLLAASACGTTGKTVHISAPAAAVPAGAPAVEVAAIKSTETNEFHRSDARFVSSTYRLAEPARPMPKK